MYYVYFGHITEDNDIEDISHRLTCFLTEDDVLKFHEEWLNKPHKYCYDCKFRVVRGTEFSLKPKEYVSKWTLRDPNYDKFTCPTSIIRADTGTSAKIDHNKFKFSPTFGCKSINDTEVTLTTLNENLGCGDLEPLSSGNVFEP